MAAKSGKTEKPDVYRYHDYRAYLKDWIAFAKESGSGFSIRSLAKSAQVSVGYLPMVLSGSRELSTKALAKLLPHLDLNPAQRTYFENLVELGTADSQEVRLSALEKMKRSTSYKKSNPKELEVYRYLTRWYYVAIREMSAMRDFKPEPLWIQGQLRVKVALGEIKEALDFLIQNGYIEVNPDGTVRPPDKTLDCVGGVYRVALTEFHREMFSLAEDSIENTESDARRILGHTFAVREEQIHEAQQIVADAMDRIKALGAAEKSGDSVYHLELALFPLTRKPRS